jgi:hypothetical protein
MAVGDSRQQQKAESREARILKKLQAGEHPAVF